MLFKTTAEDGERGGSSDMQWKIVKSWEMKYYVIVDLVFYAEVYD